VHNDTLLQRCGNVAVGSGRDSAFETGSALLRRSNACLRFPPLLAYNAPVMSWFITNVCGVVTGDNRYIGMVSFGFTQGRFNTFLQGITATDNTQLFLIDDEATVSAASDPNFNALELTNVTATTAVPAGCGTTLTAMPDFRPIQMACRKSTAAYPYAPLNALPKAFVTSDAAVVLQTVKVSGVKYYTSSMRVTTPTAAKFPGTVYNLVSILPETDVVGGVYTARDTAIGVRDHGGRARFCIDWSGAAGVAHPGAAGARRAADGRHRGAKGRR
jgi:hypothetical protein